MRKAICPKCKKMKETYVQGSDCCQKCYRENLVTFSYYKFRNDVEIPSGVRQVLDIIVANCGQKRMTIKQVVEIFGEKIKQKNVAYVRRIAKKYLVHCDTLGNERPSYMGED